eukprot:PhF_6_TR19386/c0_g1_i1/m.28386
MGFASAVLTHVASIFRTDVPQSIHGGIGLPTSLKNFVSFESTPKEGLLFNMYFPNIDSPLKVIEALTTNRGRWDPSTPEEYVLCSSSIGRDIIVQHKVSRWWKRLGWIAHRGEYDSTCYLERTYERQNDGSYVITMKPLSSEETSHPLETKYKVSHDEHKGGVRVMLCYANPSNLLFDISPMVIKHFLLRHAMSSVYTKMSAVLEPTS